MRKTLHEYVIEIDNRISSKNWDRFDVAKGLDNIVAYAALTNRAPKLGDFIPCDEDGNVLEEPKNFKQWMRKELNVSYYIYSNNYVQYQAAKDRVIFKGEWEVVKGSNSNHTRIYCEQLYTTIDFELSEVSLIRTDRSGFVLERGGIDRIENLPREIEFKDNLI